MAGYIVYNGFWNAAPSDPVCRLVSAAKERGACLTPIKNTELIVSIAPEFSVTTAAGVPVTAADFALFWDKDTRLARALETVGVRLYNSAAAVAACDDKGETHRLLTAAGIPCPKTFTAPMTYTEITEAVEPFLRAAETALGYPLVVKECYGSFGRQVYLVQNGDELRRLVYTFGSRPFLLQEFVCESAGEDTRLYLVGDTVAAAIRRKSETDFRANVELGGKAEPHLPTAAEIDLAHRCRQVLGLAFGAVDFLHRKDGTPLVCEVNSNAYMAGLTACTGVDIAGAIVDHVLAAEKG